MKVQVQVWWVHKGRGLTKPGEKVICDLSDLDRVIRNNSRGSSDYQVRFDVTTYD